MPQTTPHITPKASCPPWSTDRRFCARIDTSTTTKPPFRWEPYCGGFCFDSIPSSCLSLVHTAIGPHCRRHCSLERRHRLRTSLPLCKFAASTSLSCWGEFSWRSPCRAGSPFVAHHRCEDQMGWRPPVTVGQTAPPQLARVPWPAPERAPHALCGPSWPDRIGLGPDQSRQAAVAFLSHTCCRPAMAAHKVLVWKWAQHCLACFSNFWFHYSFKCSRNQSKLLEFIENCTNFWKIQNQFPRILMSIST
jgi:hypothetical protein